MAQSSRARPALAIKPRVLVAMSGGVDSSVAAAILQDRGLHVEGITMHLWDEASRQDECPSDAVVSARAVCEQLGIRHHTVDLTDSFYASVVEPFLEEYARGRTPNPCIRCNRFLKFGLLLAQVDALGFDCMATGHYARVVHEEGLYGLRCGADRNKDQSYFLYMLGQEQLSRVLLPLGELSKLSVREYARDRQLSVAERAESQDVCFIQDGDYRRFIRDARPDTVSPGPIYDSQGALLGEHSGLPFYTVGQRGGLGISAPRPLYVIELDAGRNALVVGHLEELGKSALIAEDVSYVSGYPVPGGQEILAKIRYRANPALARIWPLSENRARLTFDAPLRDITPGQAVVFYGRSPQHDQVLGGGLISRAASSGSDLCTNPGA